MYDVTKVKTFTPHIPAGIGPTFEKVEDAIAEMVRDLYDEAVMSLSQDKEDDIVAVICKAYELSTFIDGEYEIFLDRKLIIETMAKSRLDALPEFNGY